MAEWRLSKAPNSKPKILQICEYFARKSSQVILKLTFYSEGIKKARTPKKGIRALL